jgi:hypothetical protein
MTARSLLTSVALFVAMTMPAFAGLQVVRGEGRAVLSGKDTGAARKAALADALYDAAGRLGTRVRGASLMNQGVLREESSALVDGRFKTYTVVHEGREGSAYIVIIEAVGETEGESCSGKRADLDMRAVTFRAAPGIQGYMLRNVQEGFYRGLAVLAEGDSFRVNDQRHLPAIRGGERNNASQYDYMAQLTDSRPSIAGYSASGEILVETTRRDNYVANITDVTVTVAVQLKDNYTGARIGSIRRSKSFAGRRTIYGLEPALMPNNMAQIDMGALFDEVRAELEEKLACQPLRAAVLESERGQLMLSVGFEHGVREGDYFLVTTKNSKGNAQIVKIEDVGPTQSVGRSLKPQPVVPAHVLATLMR